MGVSWNRSKYTRTKTLLTLGPFGPHTKPACVLHYETFDEENKHFFIHIWWSNNYFKWRGAAIW